MCIYKVSSIGIGRQMAQMQVDPCFLPQMRKVDRQDPSTCIHDHLRDAWTNPGAPRCHAARTHPNGSCISAWRICAHDKLCICVFIYSCICSLPLAFYLIHSHMFSDFNFTNFQGFISGSRSFSQADQQSFTTAIPRSQLLSLVKSWLRFLVRLADIYIYIYLFIYLCIYTRYNLKLVLRKIYRKWWGFIAASMLFYGCSYGDSFPSSQTTAGPQPCIINRLGKSAWRWTWRWRSIVMSFRWDDSREWMIWESDTMSIT